MADNRQLEYDDGAMVLRPGLAEAVSVRFTAPFAAVCSFDFTWRSARLGGKPANADVSVVHAGTAAWSGHVDGYHASGAIPGNVTVALADGDSVDFRADSTGGMAHAADTVAL